MIREKKFSGPNGHEQMSESFLIGSMLAITGGFLDVYTYISRGGVFANAQTGNMALLGISLAEGRIRQAVRYLIPIAAFVAGILCCEAIRSRYKEKEEARVHWRQVVVALEILVVLATAFVPSGRWDTAVNVAISFAASLQAESFRKLRGSAFATTMCTGNLRSGTELLYRFWTTGDRNQRERSFRYYGIIGLFIAGAAVGAWATRQYMEKAALCCCAVLAAVFCMMFIQERQEKDEE